jgi:hypothetical protein
LNIRKNEDVSIYNTGNLEFFENFIEKLKWGEMRRGNLSLIR